MAAFARSSPKRPEQAPPVVLTYAEACAKAIKDNTNLIVFIQQPIQPIGVIGVSVRVESLEGYSNTCVVIARPKNGVLYYHYTL